MGLSSSAQREFGAGKFTVADDVSHSSEAGRSPYSEAEAHREEQRYALVTNLGRTAGPLAGKAMEDWLASNMMCVGEH